MKCEISLLQPGRRTPWGRSQYQGHSIIWMVLSCSLISSAHRTNLKHFILPVCLSVSYLFFVPPTLELSLAMDLHLSLFSHTWWGGEYFPTLSQCHRNWSWESQGARKPTQQWPEGQTEIFLTFLKKSRTSQPFWCINKGKWENNAEKTQTYGKRFSFFGKHMVYLTLIKFQHSSSKLVCC